MPGRRGKPAKFARLAAVGGVAAAAAAAVALKRDKLAGLLPFGGAEQPAPPAGPAPAQGPSNYDASGPPANTATPLPAPEPQVPPAIDEEAEEAAAAAEAANIGGQVSDYAAPGEPDLAATEAERPLMEAGEGEAEGQEQTEAELAAAAEPTAPGMSEEQRQIEDTIEAADNPAAGEQVEPLAPSDEPSADKPDEDDGDEWRTDSGPSVRP